MNSQTFKNKALENSSDNTYSGLFMFATLVGLFLFYLAGIVNIGITNIQGLLLGVAVTLVFFVVVFISHLSKRKKREYFDLDSVRESISLINDLELKDNLIMMLESFENNYKTEEIEIIEKKEHRKPSKVFISYSGKDFPVYKSKRRLGNEFVRISKFEWVMFFKKSDINFFIGQQLDDDSKDEISAVKDTLKLFKK